ncbi:11803_t:CDS:2, partial [Gigaspora margarita]
MPCDKKSVAHSAFGEKSAVRKGRKFEIEIVALLRRLGVKVEHTKGRNDGDVDIRGRIRGVEVVIQCKNYKEEKPI